MLKNAHNTSLLFNLELFSRTKEELLITLKSGLSGRKTPILLFTPNPEQVVIAHKQHHYMSLLHQADLLIPDGVGLVVASRILKLFGKASPLKERIPGVDIVESLLSLARERNWNVLVVGGREYSSESQQAHNQNKRTQSFVYDGLQVQWMEGYQQVANPSLEEEERLRQEIELLKPQIVFVAFGAPHQEAWIVEHQELLAKSGVRLAMAVGGSFDFLLNRVSRAPRWMQQVGLEWLYRLIQQPWRWRRQLRLIEFVWLLLLQLIRPSKHSRL